VFRGRRRVPPEIKFCGMTRAADVETAVALGAHYVGVIFAGGPRAMSVAGARELLRNVPPMVRRVGVFGPETDVEAAADVAQMVRLDVIQMHGDPDETAVAALRRVFHGHIWAAVRVRDQALPERAAGLFRAADAVVLDAFSAAALGGTGIALPWPALRDALSRVRGDRRLVLAGGLRAETVAEAVRKLGPDVVDVSSGVESAPGIKDHGKLRAFRDAVAGGFAAT